MSKTVLITGGANGIGRATALELAKNKYDIVINYLTSEEKAMQLHRTLIEEYGVNCLAIRADISKEDEVDAMVSQIEKQLGGVDILINNAAIDLYNLFHLKTAEEFRRKTNRFRCYIYTDTYFPMCFDYDASKAALISLTHNLAMQFAPYVNVNAIAPGFIGTENELDGYDEEFLKEETQKILVERYGQPEEVAYLIRFLISDQADYINNTVIRIDGGQKGSC